MGKPITERITVIGLGYVGLPLAVALAGKCDHVLGFDIAHKRVEAINAGEDWTGEVDPAVLKSSGLMCSHDASMIAGSTMIIVTVPTPVDTDKRPDLGPIRSACRTIAPYLADDVVVVFESTVYPGVTEEICGPLLAELSGLERSRFKLAYSPERINPGDKNNTLERITKVVSGEDAGTLKRVSAVYSAIIEAGIYEAASIRVAEAAKVIENTQRDINIALMNELALIFDRLGIRTKDVLKAAGTKWNFLPFTPGLVGGHCIGVDPYYLTAKAESVGHHPQVILAGRRINDDMGRFVAQKTVKLLIERDLMARDAKVGIRTKDVLKAAGTKWNFLPFTPGLVGGHCIGVDPYYLTAKAESVGHHPQVILAGRRINDDMGRFVARKTVKLLIERGLMNANPKVAILGLTFKEDVPDLRNSKVIDIVAELGEFGIKPLVHDPMVTSEDALEEYGIALCAEHELAGLDALVLAVNHRAYLTEGFDVCGRINEGGVLVDVKSAFEPTLVRDDIRYWSL